MTWGWKLFLTVGLLAEALLFSGASSVANAQTIPQQIEAVTNSVENVTNNINAFGAAMFAVIVVVVAMAVDRWRERSAAARAEKAREAAEQRRMLDLADYKVSVNRFTKVAEASEVNRYQTGKILAALVNEIRADRRESDARYQAFHSDIQTFKNDHLASIENFGERITSELSNGLSQIGDKVADAHKAAMIEVAKMQATDQQRVTSMTVAALKDMGLLLPVSLEPTKDTGPLREIPNNETSPNPTQPTATADAPGHRADGSAGADGGIDAGDNPQ